MAKTDLTAQRLRELLHYDPQTGVFTWIKPNGRKLKPGMVAGSLDRDLGYIHIGLDWELHKAHRLAWLYVYSEWPANGLDHIDGNPSNNRISNLRDVPHAVNGQNRNRPNKNNKMKLLGAWRNHDRWFSRIMDNGKLKYLGTFDTPEQANAAYVAAKRNLGI